MATRAQSSEAAASERKVPGRPFKKGQSGNPGGRMKGVAAAAREAIGNDPTKLTGIFLEIASDPKAKDGDRIAAAREYLDRAYGKAPMHSPVEGGDPLELSDTDRAVAAVLDELAAKRETEAARKSEGTALDGAGEGGAVTA